MSSDYTTWVKGAPVGGGVYWLVSTTHPGPWICQIKVGPAGELLLSTPDLALAFLLRLEAPSILWHLPVPEPPLPPAG